MSLYVTDTGVTPEMQKCIDRCTECHNICVETITYCLQMGGHHSDPGHIRILMDCADICRTSADFMLRGSDLHSQACGLCADVCERCARDCDQFANDDRMKACAEECRRCTESCRRMAVHHLQMAA